MDNSFEKGSSVSSRKRYVGPILLTSAIAGTLAMGFGGTAWAEELGTNKAAAAVSAGLSTPAMAVPAGSVPSPAELIDASVPEVPSSTEPDCLNPSEEKGEPSLEGEAVEGEASGKQEAEGDSALPETEGQTSTEGEDGPNGDAASQEDSAGVESAGVESGGSSEIEAPAPGEAPAVEGADLSQADEAANSLAASVEGSQAADSADDVVLSGWQQEGENYVYYGVDGTKSSGWLVTDEAINGTSSGLQRYWLGDKGEGVSLRADCFEAVINGVKSWFFRTDKGYVARGKYEYVNPEDGKTYFYLADNEGRLEGPGWVVTNEYEADGSLQRYWVDADAHAAVEGYSEDGWAHYTTEEGYVLRGGRDFEDGRYWADNDGRVARNGWVVTGDFTGGALERYWAGSKGAFRADGLFDTGLGYWSYAKGDTTILRGRLPFVGEDGKTYVYLADNDGRLAGPGWVVSDAYGQGLQRYWVDATTHGAKTGYFVAEGSAYFGTEAGYVLRGTKRFELSSSGKFVQVADNDGKLIENFVSGAGWQVTGAMTEGALQRYYLTSFDGHLYAEVDLFEADLAGKKSLFYGDEATGYVARNERVSVNGKTYTSDNDGRLIVATVRVYLDSGHGASGGAGFDPGASGSGYQEYKLTEELVKMVADIVRSKYGLDVVTHGDTNYSDRQDEAEANECDFLVSIHFNSFNGSATGSESYIHSAHAAPGSAELQDIMHKHLVNGTGLYDRGQKQEQFAVVGGDIPAVLLEICFIDNSSDMAQYQARKQQIAEQLAAGIWEYAQRIS